MKRNARERRSERNKDLRRGCIWEWSTKNGRRLRGYATEVPQPYHIRIVIERIG